MDVVFPYESFMKHGKRSAVSMSFGVASAFGGSFLADISPAAGAAAMGAGVLGIIYSLDQASKAWEVYFS